MESPVEVSKFCVSCGLCIDGWPSPPPELYPEVSEQDDGDHLLKPDLPLPNGASQPHEIASLEETHRKVLASIEETFCKKVAAIKETHRKRLVAIEESYRREVASRQQKNAASQKELQDFESTLEMRQLFFNFKDSVSIDTQLMEQARENFPRSKKESFSRMVIDLATQRNNITEKIKSTGFSRREIAFFYSELQTINRKLASLKEVATTFKTTEMLWNKSIGEGYYAWCFLKLSANKACHPEMTKQVLDDMYKLAQRGVYKYGGVELGDVVKAVIEKVRPS